VLNAGLGVANSGLNAALGNTSTSSATLVQTTTINDALNTVDGPQIAHNGGGASNISRGTGKVGTGNATATGNQSETDFVQAAAAQAQGGDPAFATLASGTTNAGLGLANTGINLGLGNNSTNTATLTQTADGSGIVDNEGEVRNESDGTAIIGNPDCFPEAGPGQPGGPAGLPKTGGELEVEAALGLMLLLLGFGLRRKSQELARS